MFIPGIIDAEGRPRLHGIRRQPVVMDFDLRHMGGLSDCLVGRSCVAELPVEDQIIFRFRMKLWRTGLQRRNRLDNSRKLFVIHRHGFGGIAGLPSESATTIATASPTYRAVSTANGRQAPIFIG